MPNGLPPRPTDQRLDSWKEIAAFFGRDERTVKRWEKERGLPVHRLPGGGRGTIYAFSTELTAWLGASPDGRLPHDSETAPGVDSRVSLPRTVSLVPKHAVPGGHHSRYHLPRWSVLAVGLCFGLVAFFSLSRLFLIKSVHGRVLPAISLRRNEIARHDAEDLYLKGRYFWSKRTGEDLTRALDYFTAATQRDPSFAPGYAGVADSYNLLREYTSLPASQAFPLAITAAQKAVQLDDSLSEGHRALAFAYFHWNWDVQGAEREFRRAIELNPNDVEAHHWFATALMALPRFPEAIAEIEKARQLDPTSRSIAADRADILYASGRDQEAVSILQELEKSEPDFRSPPVYLQGIYADQGQFARSLDEAEIWAKLSHDDRAEADVALSRQRLEKGGEKGFLEGRLHDQLIEFSQGRASALEIADTYARLGKKREAMDYLEKAYQRHEYAIMYLRNYRPLRILYDEPAYQEIQRRLGVAGAVAAGY